MSSSCNTSEGQAYGYLQTAIPYDAERTVSKGTRVYLASTTAGKYRVYEAKGDVPAGLRPDHDIDYLADQNTAYWKTMAVGTYTTPFNGRALSADVVVDYETDPQRPKFYRAECFTNYGPLRNPTHFDRFSGTQKSVWTRIGEDDPRVKAALHIRKTMNASARSSRSPSPRRK